MKKTLLISAALGALAAPAFAQQAPAAVQEIEDEVRVEDRIVVTMPGPSREADELIGNAAVINRDEVLDRLEASLGDTLAKEPGIASTYFGPAASRPVVRGLGAERVLVLTNSLGVIDASAASPDHQVTGDGIDAKRIEVLHGPAALAYGGQAIGGVVNVIDGLIAEELPDAPNGDVLAAYTSVNEGTELAARGQVAFGPVVLSLSASQRDADDLEIPGFAESGRLRALEEAEEEGHDDDHDDDDDHEDEEDHDHEEEGEAFGTLENSFYETQTLGGGVSLVFDNAFIGLAVRDTTATYGLPGHSHGHEHEEEEHEGEEHDEEEGEEEESPFIDLNQTRYDLRGGVKFDGMIIDRISGALSVVDYDHTEFEAPGEPGTIFTTTGHEARVEASHNEVLGFEGTFGVQQSFKKLGADGDEAFITPTKTEHFGVFLYEVRKWENDVGLEGGLRFDNSRLDNAIVGERDFDTVSGSVGLHRHLDNGLFFGGQVSYTERAPSDTELFANGPHLATSQFEVGDADLGVETGLNFEGVIRADLGSGTFGINVYATDYDDFIYLSPTGAEEDELPVFAFTQDGANFRGFEVYGDYDLSGPLGADWAFNASLDLVDAELSNGENVPYVPPVTVQLGADATWGRIGASAGLTWADQQKSSGADILQTNGYTLIDLGASYSLDGIGPLAEGTQLFVQVRNAGDVEARAATSVLKDVAPLPGRNVRAGIRLAF